MASERFELELFGDAVERRCRAMRPEVERMPWGSLDLAGVAEADLVAARAAWTGAAYQEHCTGVACCAALRATMECRAVRPRRARVALPARRDGARRAVRALRHGARRRHRARARPGRDGARRVLRARPPRRSPGPDALAATPVDAYLALAERSMSRCVVAPLRARGIAVSAWPPAA